MNDTREAFLTGIVAGGMVVLMACAAAFGVYWEAQTQKELKELRKFKAAIEAKEQP